MDAYVLSETFGIRIYKYAVRAFIFLAAAPGDSDAQCEN